MFKPSLAAYLVAVAVAKHAHQATYIHPASPPGSPTVAQFSIAALLLIVSCLLIWANQKRAAISAKRCWQAAEVCEDIVDVNKHMSRKSGSPSELLCPSLVCLRGKPQNREPIQDQLTGMIAFNSIRLTRTSEILHSAEGDADASWVLVQDYSPQPRQPHHIPSASFLPERATLCQFRLTPQLASQLEATETIRPIPRNADQLHRALSQQGLQVVVSIVGDYLYVYRRYPEEPGSVRILYRKCPAGSDVTAICGLNATRGTLDQFNVRQWIDQADQSQGTGSGCCSLSPVTPTAPIELLEQGLNHKYQAFQRLFETGQDSVALFRIIAFAILFLACLISANMLTRHMGRVPIFEAKLGWKFAELFLLALSFFLPLVLLTSSFAWLAYYSEIGLALLGCAVGWTLLLVGYQAIELLAQPRHPTSSPLSHFNHYYAP